MAAERSVMEELYNQSIKILKEGQIIKGKIVSLKTKEVLVDVGFKSEGIVSVTQFSKEDLEVGKELDFFIECIEDDHGMIGLSREKAIRIQGWDKIVKNANEGALVEGKPVKKVKGGFLIDVMGIEGFLPTSLSAFKGLSDRNILYNTFKFKIIKVNNLRHSIILSHREAMQKAKEEAKEKLWQDLKIGSICSGTVNAITDFGAFIDLGGVDGLLYITDMSWSKISHPSEVVALGDKIDVVILNLDKESGKVSLGLKQRFPDPWQDIEAKYSVSSKVKGKVVNILPYGVFVELEKGIEGLVHVSEISWTKRVNNPGEMFAIGDMVEVQVLNIDKESRKISLSLKQLEQNPWLDAESKYITGIKVQGKVRGFTAYGVFVELDNSLEGMIHISDISWTKRIAHPQDMFKKGQKLEVVVLSVDAQNRRIALGLKQLQANPWPEIAAKYPLDTVLETEVVNITDFGVFVKINEELEGLVYSSEIDKDALTQLKPGDKLKAKVIKVDAEQAKIGLSAKI
ncbi:MAG: 30S ribosomal protein S1 [Candidatus Omnitrophica bacterium]|nr:30S ribosomal protein S1 [Candidatus Omnitrophota bacterium]